MVGSEPALAARLLRIANSASLNRSGKPSPTCARRSTASATTWCAAPRSPSRWRRSARATSWRDSEHHLNDLWERSTSVAAFAYVLARTCTQVNPDEAMLDGHDARHRQALCADARGRASGTVRQRRDARTTSSTNGMPRSARRSWRIGNFSEAMAQAVGRAGRTSTAPKTEPADLSDVRRASRFSWPRTAPISPASSVALHELPSGAASRLESDKDPGRHARIAPPRSLR